MHRLKTMVSKMVHEPSAEGHMLFQDVSQRIMPYRRWHDDKPLLATITPDSDISKSLILHALGGAHYRDLEWVAAEFVRYCAIRMCAYGSVCYRVRVVENRRSRRPRRGQIHDPLASIPKVFSIDWLRPDLTKERGSNIYHLERDETDFRKTEWIVIPNEELVHFKFSEANVPWSPLIGLWLNLIDHVKFKRMEPKVDSQTKQLSFEADPTEHARLTKMAVAYFTSAIGWTGRQAFDEYTTGYFMIERQLRFTEFLICLREYILERLNRCINIAGKELQFQAQLGFTGVITKEDVRRLRLEVQSGRKISEVYKELLELQ